MLFRLSTLILATVVVAASFALAGPGGILLAGYGLLFVWAVRAVAGNRPGGIPVLLGLVLIGSMACLLPAMVSSAGPSARRAHCRNNLLQLALALENYHDAYGCFPPPYLADKDGKPMHSWRVLILPFVEQKPLWMSYRFDEPWDSASNRRLAAAMQVYRCSADGSGTPTATSYVMVTGPGTASEAMAKGEQPWPNRIVLAEVADSGIEWMEPRDLTLEEARAGINPPGVRGISSRHGLDAAHVVLARGATLSETVLFLDGTIPRKDIEALLTGNLSDAQVQSILAEMRSRQASESERRDRSLLLRVSAWVGSLAVLLVHGLIFDVLARWRTEHHDGA